MKESFEIKQETHILDFCKVAISLGFKNKKLRRLYYLLIIIGSIVGLLEFASPKPNWLHAISNLLIIVIFPLLFFIVAGFILTVLLYFIRPDFFKATFLLNHWGMSKKTATAEYSRPWSGFIKWKETKSFFLLFIVEHDAHIITKKNINETDIPDFRKFLGDRIGLF